MTMPVSTTSTCIDRIEIDRQPGLDKLTFTFQDELEDPVGGGALRHRSLVGRFLSPHPLFNSVSVSEDEPSPAVSGDSLSDLELKARFNIFFARQSITRVIVVSPINTPCHKYDP